MFISFTSAFAAADFTTFSTISAPLPGVNFKMFNASFKSFPLTRSVKRGGKVYIKIFPHKSVTKKPAEVRMGSGKGAPEYWVAVVKPGRVMFEIEGVTEAQAREAMRLASHKLPVKCKFAISEKIAEKGGEA